MQINNLQLTTGLILSFFISIPMGLTSPINPWTLVSSHQWTGEEITSRNFDGFPATNYQVYQLHETDFQSILEKAPLESQRKFQSDAILTIPLMGEDFSHFRLANSPVMMEELAAKYPEIQSYSAISESSSAHTGRLSYSPEGIRGVFRTEKGDLYIEPFPQGQTEQYVMYFGRDILMDDADPNQHLCGFNEEKDDWLSASELSRIDETHSRSENRSVGGEKVELRVFRIALAATSAYSQLKGGTVPSVLASLNEAINILNHITEQELAVRFMLIPDNDKIIWLSSASEPYININNGSGLLGQNTSAIVNAGISFGDFELGHVFTGGCTDVGGVVSGNACFSGKARGVTCHFTNNLSFVVNGTFAHEIAHQFGVSHTFNNCPGNNGQRAGITAYEPGSGTTIMSYFGACGDQNLTGGRDNYYHSGSLEQFINFTRNSSETVNCGQWIFTENTEPEVYLDYEDGFTIPIGTPFKLTAQAEDADGDQLTYCWEQMDLGPVSALEDPFGNSPLFRSFRPNNSPSRYFPRLNNVVHNNHNLSEVLPTYSRDLNFRCTVRDNNPEGGAAVWDQVHFFASQNAGPFTVEYPNLKDTFHAGELIEVKWNVANTDRNPVNCKEVEILLSTNGGSSFQHLLMSSTPNNGSAWVNLPDVNSSRCRIKVRAADNIFFNVSSTNFIIREATEPTYIFNYSPYQGVVCLPDEIRVPYELIGISNFSDSVYAKIESGLPEGAELINFPELIEAGDSDEFIIDLNNANISDEFEVVFQLIRNTDTLLRSIYFETISNDFSELELTGPSNGLSGAEQVMDFTWSKSSNAIEYEIQIANSPDFSAESMVFHELLTDRDSIRPDVFFPTNTIFYWRIRPINNCGPGQFSPVSVFQTLAQSCQTYEPSSGLPVNTPSSFSQPIKSNITIEEEAEVTEINIPQLKGLQSWVGDIGFKLVSPSGTKVQLFARKCGNRSHYDLGFDDNSPFELGCPLTTGRRYQPEEPLSIFEGEPLEGTWTMEMHRYTSGSSGTWQFWNLEVCANISLDRLSLLQNDTLFVPPLRRNRITPTILRSEEVNSTASKIVYTVVESPQFGSIVYNNTDQSPGFKFTQQDINDGKVRYRSDSPEELEDYFTFTVQDELGAWAGKEVFNIAVRNDAVTHVSENLEFEKINFYPNPTSGLIHLELNQWQGETASYTVFDNRGKTVKSGELLISGNTQLNLTQLIPGIYFLNLKSTQKEATIRVVVQ